MNLSFFKNVIYILKKHFYLPSAWVDWAFFEYSDLPDAEGVKC